MINRLKGDPVRMIGTNKFDIAYDEDKTESTNGRTIREEFELGYIRTIHKSQGGEMKNVVIIGPTICHSMWSRAGGRRLLTVAVSRAQERVYVLGHRSALHGCLQSPDETSVGRMFTN